MITAENKTIILITNHANRIDQPKVTVIKNGKQTCSTTLGYNKSEARAMEEAEAYKETYPEAEIVNLYAQG